MRVHGAREEGKMKCTFFLGGLSGGGTERVVCNLANYLSDLGHRIEILTMSDDTPSYELHASVKRIALLAQNERKNAFFNFSIRFSRLKKYMKSSDTDEYIVMLPTTIIMLLGMHRFTKAPIIVSERADPSQLSAVKKFLLKHLVKHASGFVFQTTDVSLWYRPYIGNIKNVVIPNAINEEFLSKPIHTGDRTQRIVAVGRMAEQKNFKLLIRSFAKVYRRYPAFRLILFGDGPQRGELHDLAAELGIANAVEMPGYVKDIRSQICDAYMFILSSYFEGIPNSLIEAMSLGIPCIATDCPVGGPKSLIENSYNGLLIPVNDQEQMTNAMIELIQNPKLASFIGNNAFKIREELHPAVIYSKWERFMESLLH